MTSPPVTAAGLIRTGSTLVLVSLLEGLSMVEAAPVRVRLPEGNARGFLALRSLDGHDIGPGELRQKPIGGLIEIRLVLHFKDGSLREETTVFSQRGVFRLERYQLVQRALVSDHGGLDRSEDRTVRGRDAGEERQRGKAVERAPRLIKTVMSAEGEE